MEETETAIMESARQVAGGRPSFGQDVLKGRSTEIDDLTVTSPAKAGKPRFRRPSTTASSKSFMTWESASRPDRRTCNR